MSTYSYDISYKSETPENTIRRIEGILNSNGIPFSIKCFGEETLSVSVRLNLIDARLKHLDIGTNGKGLTKEYALASAYAELMERMENKMLFFSVKYASTRFIENNRCLSNLTDKKLAFRYFPDEQYRQLNCVELKDWGKRLLMSGRALSSLPGGKYDMPFVPFYNVRKSVVEPLPYDLIRLASGSTGLCAGNNAEEAILQGLNEIFERYVLQRIYLDRQALPTINMSFFSDKEIGRRLKELCKITGWRCVIKDCSLENGFPVVGLLLIDDVNGKYTFRLGSDLRPEIALQRCFTEIFQGTEIDNSSFIPIDVSEDWDAAVEYERNVINGRGRFPNCVFENASCAIDSKEKPKIKSTIEGNFESVMDWLTEKGYELYVRDNSFMGFPAYHLYIPGLSNVDERLNNICKGLVNASDYYDTKAEYRIKRLTKSEAKQLIDKYSNDTASCISLFEYSWSRQHKLNRCLLLALLSYYVGEDGKAYVFFRNFLEEQLKSSKSISSYYYCVRDYFALKRNGRSEKDIVSILDVLYSDSTANEVIGDMRNRTNVFENFPLPDCFNCSDCKLRKECAYDDVLELERRIQCIQTETVISQGYLEKVFSNNDRRKPKSL